MLAAFTATSAELVHVTQNFVSSWKTNAVDYYKYEGAIINGSDMTLEGFTLTFAPLEGPVYGLTQIGSSTSFTFPDYQTSLPPGSSLKFVYISLHPTPSVTSLQSEKFV